MKGFVGNIEELAVSNSYFRQVIYTSQHSQLVVMCLKPGEEIGTEVHDAVDQFIRVEQGEGKVNIQGQEQSLTDGSAIVIPAGVQHNVINTSASADLKLYTVYSPPHHKDGTVHKTKQDALSDKEDHL